MTKKSQPIGEPFAPVLDRLLYGEAYGKLSERARVMLVYMIAEAPRPYRGQEIVMGCRKAADHCRCGHVSAWRALQEIKNSGLATITDLGRSVGIGDAALNRTTRWELTFWK